MSEAPPDAQSASVAVEIPLDTDDTRSRHLRELMSRPLTQLGGGGAVLATFIALAASTSVAIGAGAAVGVALVIALVLFGRARSLAKKDFFRAYAEARGLEWTEQRTDAPPLTDLLRSGERRYFTRTFRGALPGGLHGMLAYFTFETTSTDGKGHTQTNYHPFTITISDLPELAPYLKQFAVQSRSGFRFLDSLEDRFRKRQRVELESEAADRRYEVFIGQHDDMNRARQVLSPSFIVWLADEAPEEFSFELSAGALVCAVKGHCDTAAELDGVCRGASAVARRLLAETME